MYVLEPMTKGKVVLHTTVGAIDIELWSKEAPKACRNFVQLCLEGYYNNTIFHRIVTNFIVQGGDPTATGTGGESVYGKPFPDEFHSRLKFNHRGLVAMANPGKDQNQSQFFITLDRTQELDRKHTIFGKVTGDTIFNVLKMNESEVDANERPIYPPKILSTELLWNPFDDISPRQLPQPVPPPSTPASTSKAKKIKNFNLLSFGDEAEYEEKIIETETKTKMKGSYYFSKDPRVQKYLQDSLLIEENDIKIGAKMISEDIDQTEEQEMGDPSEFDKKMKEKILKKREEEKANKENKTQPNEKRTLATQDKKKERNREKENEKNQNRQREKQKEEKEKEESNQFNDKEKEKNTDKDSDSDSGEKEKQRKKATRLTYKIKKEKEKEKEKDNTPETEANADKKLMTEQRNQCLKALKTNRTKSHREQKVLEQLAKFKGNLQKSIQPEVKESMNNNNNNDDDNDDGWMNHSLSFEKTKRKLDDMDRVDSSSHYSVFDPLKGSAKKTKHQMHMSRLGPKNVEKW